MDFYNQEYAQLKINKKNNQLWISLDNPEQSNAITSEMTESLIKVLKFADFDSEIRVIILTGEGKNFCSGGDIKAMENKAGMFSGESNELRMRYMHGIQQIPKCMEDMSTPVIAMIQGAAVGAGCDLAMMCDLRIGTLDSKFGETFVRIGLVPGDGGSFFLQRAIGFSKAMQMSLTAELVSGEEALRWGLLNYLVSDKELHLETEKLALKIASNAPAAVQMTKKAMKIAYLNDLATVLDIAAAFQGIAQRTEDHFEGLAAAKAKKIAQFQGR